MNEGAQAVIGVIVILLILAVCLSPIIGLWVYIIYQNSKRKGMYERILNSRRDMIGNNRWFKARYASQQRFDAMFKIMPWEAVGILVVVTGSVLFMGETLSGSPIVLQFAPGNSRIAWLGKCAWPNGAVSWLRFDTADQKHYFSSETGILIFGSHPGTKAMYDEANRNFGAPPAYNI